MTIYEAKVEAKKLVDFLAENEFENCLEKPFQWIKLHRPLMETKGINIYYGATKIVVVPDWMNWVIKFDMERSNGLCALEALNYENAVLKGIGDYFARTYVLGDFFGTTATIQEFVEVDSDENHDSFIRYYTSDGEDEEDAEWMIENEMGDYERFMAIFSGKDYGKTDRAANWIIDEIDSYEFDADFHEGNFGRNLEGNMVLFDFSGYTFRG